MYLLSRDNAEALHNARGNPAMLSETIAQIRRAAKDREVLCPDESGLPTGTLRGTEGFRLVPPAEFYAAVRAAHAGQPVRQRRAATPVQHPAPRLGKTDRDRASGAVARRLTKRGERDAACQARKGAPGKQ